MIGAFLGTALELMRLVPLIIFWVKSRFLAGTERAKVRCDDRLAGLAGLAAGCGRALAQQPAVPRVKRSTTTLLPSPPQPHPAPRAPLPLCLSVLCRTGCGRTRPWRLAR